MSTRQLAHDVVEAENRTSVNAVQTVKNIVVFYPAAPIIPEAGHGFLDLAAQADRPVQVHIPACEYLQLHDTVRLWWKGLTAGAQEITYMAEAQASAEDLRMPLVFKVPNHVAVAIAGGACLVSYVIEQTGGRILQSSTCLISVSALRITGESLQSSISRLTQIRQRRS